MNLLEKYYQSAITKDSDWLFYVGVAEYVQFCETNPIIKQYSNKFKQERDKRSKHFDKLHNKLLSETKIIGKKVVHSIKEHRIDILNLDGKIKDYNNILDGSTQFSSGQAVALFDALASIINTLYINGYQDKIIDYIEEYPGNEVIKKYTFAPAIEAYNAYKKKESKAFQDELFGIYNELLTLYEARYKKDKIFDELDGFFDMSNFSFIVGELDKIREMHEYQYRNYDDFKPIQFKREDYQSHIDRIHNFLLTKLSEKTINNDPQELQISYDESKYVLKIDFDKEYNVLIVKGKLNLAHDVLTIVFNNEFNKDSKYYYKEIADELRDFNYKKERYYKAIRQINNKVFKETRGKIDKLFENKMTHFYLNN
jgi:hypothetical protein